MLMSMESVLNQNTVPYLRNWQSSDQKPNFWNRFREDALTEQTFLCISNDYLKGSGAD